MIYLITEDSNSARDFWIKAFDTFYRGSYKLVKLPVNDKGISFGGNGTIRRQINSIIRTLSRGDTLAIAFDNIKETPSFSPRVLVSDTIKKCRKLGINLNATTYYCFEEMYLSYDETLKMYEKVGTNEIVLNTLRYVHKAINDKVDYFDDSGIVNKFIEYYGKDSWKNREHFANALLMEVTKSLSKWLFIIKKSKCFDIKGSGQCWINDCSVIQKSMHPKQVQKQCNLDCGFMCKNCTAKEKLLDLESKSICRVTGLGLSKL